MAVEILQCIFEYSNRFYSRIRIYEISRYRYIRYEDGSEELYDHEFDPEEWENIAGDPEQAELIFRFRLELPRRNAKYHASTKKKSINEWFQTHLKANGIQ